MISRTQYNQSRALEPGDPLEVPSKKTLNTLTIVPYVIKPTNAYGGSKLKAMMIESFNAFKLSSSWQVSTTNRKIGGEGAGLASLYSMVVD
jgi:hypothetical protein